MIFAFLLLLMTLAVTLVAVTVDSKSNIGSYLLGLSGGLTIIPIVVIAVGYLKGEPTERYPSMTDHCCGCTTTVFSLKDSVRRDTIVWFKEAVEVTCLDGAPVDSTVVFKRK